MKSLLPTNKQGFNGFNGFSEPGDTSNGSGWLNKFLSGRSLAGGGILAILGVGIGFIMGTDGAGALLLGAIGFIAGGILLSLWDAKPEGDRNAQHIGPGPAKDGQKDTVTKYKFKVDDKTGELLLVNLERLKKLDFEIPKFLQDVEEAERDIAAAEKDDIPAQKKFNKLRAAHRKRFEAISQLDANFNYYTFTARDHLHKKLASGKTEYQELIETYKALAKKHALLSGYEPIFDPNDLPPPPPLPDDKNQLQWKDIEPLAYKELKESRQSFLESDWFKKHGESFKSRFKSDRQWQEYRTFKDLPKLLERRQKNFIALFDEHKTLASSPSLNKDLFGEGSAGEGIFIKLPEEKRRMYMGEQKSSGDPHKDWQAMSYTKKLYMLESEIGASYFKEIHKINFSILGRHKTNPTKEGVVDATLDVSGFAVKWGTPIAIVNVAGKITNWDADHQTVPIDQIRDHLKERNHEIPLNVDLANLLDPAKHPRPEMSAESVKVYVNNILENSTDTAVITECRKVLDMAKLIGQYSALQRAWDEMSFMMKCKQRYVEERIKPFAKRNLEIKEKIKRMQKEIAELQKKKQKQEQIDKEAERQDNAAIAAILATIKANAGRGPDKIETLELPESLEHPSASCLAEALQAYNESLNYYQKEASVYVDTGKSLPSGLYAEMVKPYEEQLVAVLKAYPQERKAYAATEESVKKMENILRQNHGKPDKPQIFDTELITTLPKSMQKVAEEYRRALEKAVVAYRKHIPSVTVEAIDEKTRKQMEKEVLAEPKTMARKAFYKDMEEPEKNLLKALESYREPHRTSNASIKIKHPKPPREQLKADIAELEKEIKDNRAADYGNLVLGFGSCFNNNQKVVSLIFAYSAACTSYRDHKKYGKKTSKCKKQIEAAEIKLLDALKELKGEQKVSFLIPSPLFTMAHADNGIDLPSPITAVLGVTPVADRNVLGQDLTKAEKELPDRAQAANQKLLEAVDKAIADKMPSLDGVTKRTLKTAAVVAAGDNGIKQAEEYRKKMPPQTALDAIRVVLASMTETQGPDGHAAKNTPVTQAEIQQQKHALT